MKKLYKSNEVLFAVLWIVIYVVGSGLLEQLSEELLHVEKSVTLIGYLAMTAVLLGFTFRNGLTKKYGLCAPKVPAQKMLFYLPLLALGTLNLWFGVALKRPVADTVCYAAAMLLVGFLEEFIMRGLLFRAIAKSNVREALVITSVAFGLGHVVNLVKPGADIFATLCQIAYAAALGFMFVETFYRSGSLLPAILCHSLVDLTSTFNTLDNMPATTYSLLTLGISVGAALYAVALIALIKKPALSLDEEPA